MVTCPPCQVRKLPEEQVRRKEEEQAEGKQGDTNRREEESTRPRCKQEATTQRRIVKGERTSVFHVSDNMLLSLTRGQYGVGVLARWPLEAQGAGVRSRGCRCSGRAARCTDAARRGLQIGCIR